MWCCSRHPLLDVCIAMPERKSSEDPRWCQSSLSKTSDLYESSLLADTTGTLLVLCVRGCLTKRWHSPALERCWIVLLSMVVVKAVLVPLLGMFANLSTLFEFPGEASSQNDNINVPLTSSQDPISRQRERVQCVSPSTAILMVEVPRPKRRSRIGEDIQWQHFVLPLATTPLSRPSDHRVYGLRSHLLECRRSCSQVRVPVR